MELVGRWSNQNHRWYIQLIVGYSRIKFRRQVGSYRWLEANLKALRVSRSELDNSSWNLLQLSKPKYAGQGYTIKYLDELSQPLLLEMNL